MEINNHKIVFWGGVRLLVGFTMLLFGCAGLEESVNRQHQKINRGITKLDRQINSGIDQSPVGKSNTRKQTSSTVRHEVKYKGETLSIIAKWYTGDPGNWRSIARRNPSLNPDRLSMGATVWIPEGLVITGKPLPQWYAQKHGGASDAASKKSVPEEPSEDAELFGPLDYDED